MNVRTGRPQPLFVPGDLDGFFGLAIDNLIQFLLILALCTGVLGFSVELVLGRVLPGAALSILVGNFYYAWQAQKLSARECRADVTALPYGINTVSLFAYVFLVMLPVRSAALANGLDESEAALLAWRVGLAACVVSAVMEIAGAFVGEWVRRHSPRAALLSTLAGIAISFIAIDFAIKTFETPLVALLPLGIILTTYFANVRLPARIPGGAWAVLAGSIAAWCLWAAGDAAAPVSPEGIRNALGTTGFYFPVPVLGDLIAGLTADITYQYFVPVMIPMGLFNILGSLQNIESAEAAGDRYPTAPCMAANGVGSLVAAAFGSVFPTTIYIGHPGWKGLGARSGYSILNGVFFVVMALFGLTYLVNAIVPMEAGIAIVLWIGIIITAQAFDATDSRHAPAVAVGLFPAIAAWGLLILSQTLGAAGMATGNPELATAALENPGAFAIAGLRLNGLIAISQGFMITCMLWSATSAFLIDRDFRRAAIWMLVGAGLSFFGFIHAGSMSAAGAVYEIGFGTGARWALGYALCAAFFALMDLWTRRPGVVGEGAGH